MLQIPMPKRCQESLAREIEMFRRQKTRQLAESVQAPRPENWGLTSTYQFYLALIHLWEGEIASASDLMASSAQMADAWMDHFRPSWSVGSLQTQSALTFRAALAYALAGDDSAAQTRFLLTERYCGLLLPDEAGPPVSHEATLDPMMQYPLRRAYCLIRAGRLSGFPAALYDLPIQDARNAKLVWHPETDIVTFMQTIAARFQISKARKEETFPTERGLAPVLTRLAEYLTMPRRTELKQAAQKELTAYYHMAEGVRDLLDIYPLVLDLQRSFPEIFTPVVPDPLQAN